MLAGPSANVHLHHRALPGFPDTHRNHNGNINSYKYIIVTKVSLTSMPGTAPWRQRSDPVGEQGGVGSGDMKVRLHTGPCGGEEFIVEPFHCGTLLMGMACQKRRMAKNAGILIANN